MIVKSVESKTGNRKSKIVFLLVLLVCCAAHAQVDSSLRVLVVVAHPDDETTFAATIYKITHDLKGRVDLALITNGEAGFKYSTLAESIYGVELTDEKVGREHLPTIRKNELMAAGKIIGIRNYFFLDQQDNTYTLNVDSVLRHVWDVPLIRKRLGDIIRTGGYDYILCLLPTVETHGHHKGATILALRTVREMSGGKKPIVLAGTTSTQGDTVRRTFTGLDGYPETSIRSGAPSFMFDRTQKFGFRERLDYKIIVNWEIAEHKSQGTMQAGMNRDDYEHFWFFDINDPKGMAQTAALFERLKRPMFESKTY